MPSSLCHSFLPAPSNSLPFGSPTKGLTFTRSQRRRDTSQPEGNGLARAGKSSLECAHLPCSLPWALPVCQLRWGQQLGQHHTHSLIQKMPKPSGGPKGPAVPCPCQDTGEQGLRKAWLEGWGSGRLSHVWPQQSSARGEPRSWGGALCYSSLAEATGGSFSPCGPFPGLQKTRVSSSWKGRGLGFEVTACHRCPQECLAPQSTLSMHSPVSRPRDTTLAHTTVTVPGS